MGIGAVMERDAWAVLTTLLALALVTATVSHTGLSNRTRFALLFMAGAAFALGLWRSSTL